MTQPLFHSSTFPLFSSSTLPLVFHVSIRTKRTEKIHSSTFLLFHSATRFRVSPIYLERFFRNLLLGEQWDLRNRYLHIHPTEEWKVQPNLADPTSTRTTTRTSTRTSSFVNTINTASKIYTNNDNIIELVRVIGYEEMSIKQMMELKGLKHRQNFIDYHLTPALKERFVRMKYPDRPNHPRQRYLLTVKGQMLYQELTKE